MGRRALEPLRFCIRLRELAPRLAPKRSEANAGPPGASNDSGGLASGWARRASVPWVPRRVQSRGPGSRQREVGTAIVRNEKVCATEFLRAHRPERWQETVFALGYGTSQRGPPYVANAKCP